LPSYTPAVQSLTAHAAFENSYGDGSTTTGTVYTDTVSVGDLAVSGQSTNAATTIAGVLASVPTDGCVCNLLLSSASALKPQQAVRTRSLGFAAAAECLTALALRTATSARPTRTASLPAYARLVELVRTPAQQRAQLIKNGAIASPIFGLRLSLVQGLSQLYLGGVDTTQFNGPIDWYPVRPRCA
jgi:hypothetical protein